MGRNNAVVVPRATLAKLMGVSEATVKRAVAVLKEGRWIQVVQLGGKGGVNAYVVNRRVAWSDSRDKLHLAIFDATVVADSADQVDALDVNLRQIPVLYSGERQLPTGPGEEPPSQPSIPDLEVDLPALSPDVADRNELERRGQQRLTD